MVRHRTLRVTEDARRQPGQKTGLEAAVAVLELLAGAAGAGGVAGDVAEEGRVDRPQARVGAAGVGVVLGFERAGLGGGEGEAGGRAAGNAALERGAPERARHVA